MVAVYLPPWAVSLQETTLNMELLESTGVSYSPSSTGAGVSSGTGLSLGAGVSVSTGVSLGAAVSVRRTQMV